MGRLRVKSNFKKAADDFKQLSKDIRKATFTGVDREAEKLVKDLRSRMTAKVKEVQKDFSLKSATGNVPKDLSMPKYETDLLEHLFGEDIDESEYVSRFTDPKWPSDEYSNIFFLKNGRIEVYEPVVDGKTYREYEAGLKRRLGEGIVIDPATGEIFKLDPQNLTGAKIKCSSSKKSDEARLNEYVSKGKDKIIMTAYRDNLTRALKESLPVRDVLDLIVNGKYKQASNLVSKFNNRGIYNDCLTNIRNLEQNKVEEDTVAPDARNLNNIIKSINNIRIKKIQKRDSVDYVVTSMIDSTDDSTEKFVDDTKSILSAWLIDTEQDAVNAISDQIGEVIKRYQRG